VFNLRCRSSDDPKVAVLRFILLDFIFAQGKLIYVQYASPRSSVLGWVRLALGWLGCVLSRCRFSGNGYWHPVLPCSGFLATEEELCPFVFGDGGRHVGGVSELVSSFELICCADWCAHALARRASLHAPYRSLWLANKLTFGFLSKAKKDEKTPKVGSYFGYLGPSILLGHQGSENSQRTNRFLPR